MDFGMSLFLDFFIGTVGFAYFLYGKKTGNFHFLIFGIVLMVYTFFVPNFVVSIILGIVFAIAPFITNKYL